MKLIQMDYYSIHLKNSSIQPIHDLILIHNWYNKKYYPIPNVNELPRGRASRYQKRVNCPS